MHYIAVRLLNFRRIDATLFNELLCEKFGLTNAEPLFEELYQKGGIRLYFQVIVVTNDDILLQYRYPEAYQPKQLRKEAVG
jgi:hypothetical protein